jgi:hypothetical protein
MQADSSCGVGLTPPLLTCNADYLLELKSDLTLIEGLRRYKAKAALRLALQPRADEDDNAAHDWALVSPIFSIRHPVSGGC